MAQTVYVVTCNGKPESVFSDQAAANAYALRENNLDKQRHPLRSAYWSASGAIEIDAKAAQA